MSIEVDALKYLGLYEEPDGSYQVDHSGTPADFLPFPYKEGTLEAKGGRAVFDPMTGKMRLDGHSKKVLGPKANTVNVATMLHSHGLDLDGDVAPPTTSTWALLRMMKAIMGGTAATTNPGAQTTVQAGSTSTSIVLTTGHGARFQRGMPIACETVSGSSLLEVGEVLSVATDTVALKYALSAAPVTGTAVRGGVCTYPTERPLTSLQVLVEGREGSDGGSYRGLQGNFSLQLPVGGEGTIGFALAGAGWDRLASAVTIPSYAIFNPFALSPLKVVAPTLGSTTRVELEVSAITIEPQFQYAPQKSGKATETIARMIRQAVRPLCRGNFVVPLEDDTWFNAWRDRENRALFVQCGALAGGVFFVSLPTIQITDVARTTLENGVAGQQVTFEARHDEESGAGTSELGYAAMRCSWL